MNDDLYELLGVSRDASTDEIKKAYRKRARKLHPDVNPDPGAQEEYKRVSQAYETLSNPEKRRMYDMGGGTGASGGFGGFGFSDIFDMFAGASGMGGRSAGPIPRQSRGGDILRRATVSLRDVVFGTDLDIQYTTAGVCEVCQGHCCAPGTGFTRCTVCQGSGHVQRVAQSLLGQVMTSAPCAACQGHGDRIDSPCTECSGRGRVQIQRTVKVRVPSGIQDGTRIQLRGEGEVGEAAGPSGDLYVELRIQEDELYERDGDDLVTHARIPMTAAALGTSVPLQTFDGERSLDVPPGSQPADVLTLKGLGITALRSERRGDLRVILDVEVPRSLTSEQKELLKQFASSRGDESPEHSGRPSAERGGMFERLRERFQGR